MKLVLFKERCMKTQSREPGHTNSHNLETRAFPLQTSLFFKWVLNTKLFETLLCANVLSQFHILLIQKENYLAHT